MEVGVERRTALCLSSRTACGRATPASKGGPIDAGDRASRAIAGVVDRDRAGRSRPRAAGAARLGELRREADLTQEEVAERLLSSAAKISRLENNERAPQLADIRELARLYELSDADTAELLDLARAARERAWWQSFAALSSPAKTYLGLEAAASSVRAVDLLQIHGLLQTPDYARAVFDASSPPLSSEDVERMVLVRTQRQQGVFSGRAEARIHAVLNEAVLARRVGGPEVAAAQLKHVRDLNATDRVNIRVLTYDSGAHASMRGSFTLLEFADPDEPSVVYVESPAGARLIEKPAQFESHREVFKSLTEQSIPLEEYAP